jgi:hypothetical protein
MRLGSDSAAGELQNVAAITPDGLLIGSDGMYVRYLEVGAVNPLVLDGGECERISAGFAQLASRLPDRQSLQLYIHATPLDVQGVVDSEAALCEQAADAAEAAGEQEHALRVRRFGVVAEQSLQSTTALTAPVTVRYLIVCPWRPAERPRRRPGRGGALQIKPRVHQRAVRESQRHIDGIRSDLEAMNLPARQMNGQDVLDLLHARFNPADTQPDMEGGVLEEPLSGENAADAARRASGIALALCATPVDFCDRSFLRIGESVERVFYISLAPAQTWLGWLLHATQSPCPYTLSIHVQATDRYRERMAQRRRYRRIHGVNRGVEAGGKPVDPDALVQEREAAELNDELAASAGSGIYRLSIYLALRDPPGDVETQEEIAQSVGRELSMASDARVNHGMFAQQKLWQSTLPLGHDTAGRRQKYVTANVGDTVALCGTACGSPTGIPLGYAAPGRTLERLDPFDAAHPNHMLLINGMSGAGKTMAAILLLARAIAQGARGCVIDRAGHFEFLCNLIGGTSLEIGAAAHAINAWDVPDPASVGAEKIDFLLALHAQLLGEHNTGRDSYGLSDLEANLLGLAIGEVYQRCAVTGRNPASCCWRRSLSAATKTNAPAGRSGSPRHSGTCRCG